MRNIKVILIMAVATLFLSLSAHSAQAQAVCNTATEIRAGEEWAVLQEDCFVATNYALPRNMDFNGNCIIAVNPNSMTLRFTGAIVRNVFPDGKYINMCVTAHDLTDRGVCFQAPGSGLRLSGARFRNMTSLDIQGARITNINFGVNRQCGEGFGLWIDNPDPSFRSQVRIKNLRVDGYQRAGVIVNGFVDYYEVHSDVGKCSSEGSQNCTGAQFGAGTTSATYVNSQNSQFAQNNNYSGFGGFRSMSVLFASSMVSEILNCQLRDGNSNSGIFISEQTMGPIIDNCKLSESGDDGAIPGDRGIDDRGFGTQIRNLDPNAKIRGYSIPIYHLYPTVQTMSLSSQSFGEAEGAAHVIW